MSKPQTPVKTPVAETPPVVPSPAVAPVATAPATTPASVVTVAPPATNTNAPTEVSAATLSSGNGEAAAPAPEAGQPKPLDTDPKPFVFTAEDHARIALQREAKAHEQQLRQLRRHHPVIEKLCKEMEQLKAELAALKKT